MRNLTVAIQHASKTYADLPRKALDNVSLTIHSGRIMGIVGPNGAGKTTLMKAIAGLVELNGGEILFTDGGRPAKLSVALLLDGIRGYYPNLTVQQNFLYFTGLARASGKAPDRADVASWLERFHLDDKRHVKCQTLSRGMLQRLGLMIAAASQADIILLDEPTVGLDIAEAQAFFRFVREFACQSPSLIVFNSHQPETILGLADEMVVIQEGKIQAVLLEDQLAGLDSSSFVAWYLKQLGTANAGEPATADQLLRPQPDAPLVA